MTLLTTRTTWKRTTALAKTHTPDLTDAEGANLRRALRFLSVQVGGGRKLAALLRANPRTVWRAMSPSGKPRAVLAMRAARLAGVTLEEVLGGAWPPEGACPHCGRV